MSDPQIVVSVDAQRQDVAPAELMVLQVAAPSGSDLAVSSDDPTDLANSPVSSVGGVDVQVSYANFSELFGGDWSERLLVRAYPACFLTDPNDPVCSTPTPVEVTNDEGSQALKFTTLDSSDVTGADSSANTNPPLSGGAGDAVTPRAATTSGSPTVYAVSSGPGGYGATPVSATGNWQVGTGSGEFSYGYGLKLPPANAGATPDMSLAYSSGAVDGMTSAANGQAGQMGLGWDMDPGSITRSYYSCDDDGRAGKFDLCWHTENGNLVEDLTLSLNGRSERLVAVPSAPNNFRLINDPGWKVIRIRGNSADEPSNADNDNEGFEVITPDGIQYWFGWGHVGTDAVLTVPVFGDDAGEPCYSSTTSAAWCQQGWKWMLDRVVDPSLNKTTYFYTTDSNYYARWGTTNTVYDTSAELTSVAYGYDRSTDTAQETLSVTRSRRCTRNADTDPNTDCSGVYAPGGTEAKATIYPDVPLDLVCAQTQQCQAAPSFFSLWMYNTATSKVGTTIADTWSFTHTFPDPDTTTSPSVRDLWLKAISHTGYSAGGSLSSPDVTFGSVSLQNRVNPGQTNKYFKFRVASVTNETGGKIDVTYGHATGRACTSSYVSPTNGDPALNIWASTNECFATQWLNDATSGTKQLNWTWFHKYVVTKLVLSDSALAYDASGSTTALGKPQTYTYQYLGKPGWRYTASPSKPKVDETWSDWRGYPVTVVRRLDTDGTVLSQERVARFRGLDGTLANNDPRSSDYRRTAFASTIEMGDSDPDVPNNADQPDKPWLNGQVAEDALLVPDGQPSAGAVISRTYHAWKPDAVYTIDNTGPNGEDIRSARLAIPYFTKQVTGLFNADGTAKGTSRSRTVSYTYDETSGLSINTGRLLSALDTGDPSTPNDDSCTQYQSATNNSLFIRGPSRTRTWAWSQSCAPSDAAPDASKLLRQQQVYYDGQTSTIIKGLPTTVDVSTGAGSDQALIRTAASYDAYGRITSQTAPAYVKALDGIATSRGIASTNVYNPGGNAGAPITSIKTTQADINAIGDDLVTTTVYDKLRGQPTQITDPNGGNTLLTYDPLGELTQVREPGQTAADPANLIYDYTLFGGWGQPAKVRARALRDDTGPSPVYDDSYSYYDGWGHVVETQTPQPNDTSKRIVAFTGYDARGLAAITAPAVPNDSAPGTGLLNAAPAEVVRYATTTYDAVGRPAKITKKSNATAISSTSTTYLGDATIAQPASGGLTVTRLDGRGNPSQVELHSTPTPGSIGQSGDSVLDQSSYGYDPVGDLTSMTKAVTTTGGANDGASANYTWSYGYDIAGRRIWAYDPDTGTTATQYDAGGQPTTATTGPQASTIDLTSPYNPTIPNPTSVITTQYDAIERPTQRLDYTDVHSDTDQPVTLASWAYDDHAVANSLGRQTSETVPITNITNVLGGHGGNHVTKVKAYDNRGNATDATETVPNWTFNPLANNPDDTTTWEWTTSHNEAGQPTVQNYPAVPGIAAQTVTTSYLTGGRVASITTNDGTTAGAHIHLADETYNNIGQTNTLDTGRFAGDPTGRTAQSDGLQRTYNWELTTGRLTSATATIATQDPATTYDALKLGYAYDAAGNPTLVKDTTKDGPGGTVTPIVKQFCYTYDPAQRLQRAATGAAGDDQCSNPNSAPTDPINTWADPNYDLSYSFTGDRLTGVTENIPSTVAASVITVNYQNTNAGTSATPGAPHQTTATVTATSGSVLTDLLQNLGWPRELPNPGNLTYDTNGRIKQWAPTLPVTAHPDGGTGATGFTYDYDHQGRLTKTTPAVPTNNTVVNSYNADGTRFMRQNIVGAVVQGQTVYLADGTEIDTDLKGLYSTRRFATPAGTPTASVQGSNASNPRWTVLFADAQNTVRLTALPSPGATSSDVKFLNYFPYGDYTQEGLLAAPTGTEDDHGYLNKVRDLTQDVRLDQRSYTPDFNQLTTPDPILTPSDPLSANPYSYSRNNPVRLSDPSGLTTRVPTDGDACDAECQAVDDPKTPIQVADMVMEDSLPGHPLWNEYAATSTALDDGERKHPDFLAVADLAFRLCGQHVKSWCSSDAAVILLDRRNEILTGQLGPALLLSPGFSPVGMSRGLGGSLQGNPAANAAGAAPYLSSIIGEAGETEAGLAGKICFAAGTQVLMADGTKKSIEDVRIGDLVMTVDPETGIRSPHRVKRLFKHVADGMYELTVKDRGSVKATPEHPFYVEGRGWTPIKDLRPGDKLRQPDGSTTEVGDVRALDEAATVYNFEVEAAHDYFVKVGDSFVLVHNVCDLDLEGVEHATARHTWGGSQLTRDSSVFDSGVDLGELSGRSAGQVGRIGDDGNIEYVIRGQGIVGVTGRSASNPSGTPTHIFTIVRDPYDGSLITMFPGTP